MPFSDQTGNVQDEHQEALGAESIVAEMAGLKDPKDGRLIELLVFIRTLPSELPRRVIEKLVRLGFVAGYCQVMNDLMSDFTLVVKQNEEQGQEYMDRFRADVLHDAEEYQAVTNPYRGARGG